MSEFVPLEFEDVGKMRVELEQARAEIKRLSERVHYANGVADLAIKHRNIAEALNTEAAAFLDRMAERFEFIDPNAERAADCRAEAQKLRGET